MKTDPDSSADEILDKLSAPTLSKQPPLRKNHFFTFFYEKVPNFNFDAIIKELRIFAYKGKVQSEACPTSGRLHLQGMVWCENKHRDTEFKLLKGGHFRKMKDELNKSNYCGKEYTFTGEYRAEWGFPPPPPPKYVEKIENFYDWEGDIIELLEKKPDKRTIYWFWETVGCKGKTTFQKYIFSNYDNCVVLSGKGADMKNGIVDYYNTNKKLPKIILINIPRSAKGFVSYTGLEEIKDMFFYSGKYEGGMVCGECPHVLCFANEEPNYAKMSEDRFVVKNIGDITP